MSYAKIDTTTWDLQSPTRSSLKGCDREFDHEMSCARYERMDKDCNCYVSRIRLVKTPVGEFIPTTEPDLRPKVRNWQARAGELRREAKHWERQAWIARGLFFAMGIIGAVMVAL